MDKAKVDVLESDSYLALRIMHPPPSLGPNVLQIFDKVYCTFRTKKRWVGHCVVFGELDTINNRE